MAIGEQDPARARVDAALEVGWQLGRAYGLEQGYDQARREYEARWVDESRRRLFIAGEVINTLPISEREAQRLAVIKEGHDSGIHEGGRIGCPWCARPRLVKPVSGDSRELVFGSGELQPHHNRHYGAAQDDWWCRVHGRRFGDCRNADGDTVPCAAAPHKSDHGVVTCPDHGQPMLAGMVDRDTGLPDRHCVCTLPPAGRGGVTRELDHAEALTYGQMVARELGVTDESAVHVPHVHEDEVGLCHRVRCHELDSGEFCTWCGVEPCRVRLAVQ